MKELKLGQVWRQQCQKPVYRYGDIDSWQVNQMGKRCAVVMNCATTKEIVVTSDAEPSFTFDNKLISEKPRWPEYVKES